MVWGTASAISAAGINAATNIWATNKSNKASKHAAQAQMAFEERMSNTAHQREVADLKAAGLNPVLSANNGASTPGGASYTADTANVQPGSDALSAYAMLKQTELTKAQEKAVKKQETNTEANTEQTKIMTPELIKESQTRQNANIATAMNTEQQAKQTALDNKITEQEIKWRKKHPWLWTLERGSQAFGEASKVVGNFVGMATKTGLALKSINSAEKMAREANESRERIANAHEKARENERRGYRR